MASPAYTADRRRLAHLRLIAQDIARPIRDRPGDVVRHMLAMQAQDFAGALWSVGLRTGAATENDVTAALDSGDIVRSWPLRGTLHFVPGPDLGWMLALTSRRLITRAATRHRDLGLDDATFEKARAIAVDRLEGGRVLSRDALLAAFSNLGIDVTGQRGYHLLWYLGQTGTLVFGPPTGTKQTFTLLGEWVLQPRQLDHDEALGEFAARYFTSHGPATVRDFAWWSSLTLREARLGLAVARGALAEIESGGISYFLDEQTLAAPQPAAQVHALPGFDEYLLGYQDRSAVINAEHQAIVVPGGNGVFSPTIVVDGEVVGTWRRPASARGADVVAQPFSTLSEKDAAAFSRALTRYARFTGKPARLADPG